uniref:Odorant receptor n=1 Tax=Conopomorpha sinensis TaxID=940481 RepID=A0A3S7SGS9_9NEOP|nr:putative odorant receptor 1 [Conopomorpha sinensis]
MEVEGGECEEYFCDVKLYEDIVSSVQKVGKIVSIRLQTNDSPKAKRFWSMFFWFEFLNVVVGCILECVKISQTAGGRSFEHMVEIFLMVPCVGYIVLSMSKSWSVMRGRSTCERLLRTLHALWPRGPLSRAEHTLIRSAMYELNIFVKGYQVCNWTTLTIYYTTPVAKLIHSWTGADVNFVLPFFYWLPYDFQKYIFPTLVTQMWHGMLVVMFVTVSDLLYCVLLNQISMQFELLAIQLRHIVQVPCDRQLLEEFPLGIYNQEYRRHHGALPSVTTMDDPDTEAKLGHIIKRHVALIKLGSEVEDLMSFSLLTNFLNSSMILCFCGFCCVLVEKWNELPYKCFLTMAMSQTWLLCWYGQRLMDSSLRVAAAAYNCGWYQVTTNVKKSLLFIMLRAKKPVCVTTYGFTVIGFNCYTTIVKTAWSYFTLLVNVYRSN